MRTAFCEARRYDQCAESPAFCAMTPLALPPARDYCVSQTAMLYDEEGPAYRSIQNILAGPDTGPRYFLLGPDTLELVDMHLRASAATAAGDEARASEAAQQVSQALEWLPRAWRAGLLQDCSEADIAAAEEEWSVLEAHLAAAS